MKWILAVMTMGTLTLAGLSAAEAPFLDHFEVSASDWSSKGRNPYFNLIPGVVLTLEGKEDGKSGLLVITVLNETKTLAGVETRVVEERESQDGQLIEVSRNYFAISKKDNSLYYFGEDVDNYKDGKIKNHGGSWHAGQKGARFGLYLPGSPTVGMRYYEEYARGQAMDRAEVISINASYETPSGKYTNCLQIEETTPLEKGEKETKFFTAGIGPVMDGALKLAKVTSPSEK